MRSRIAALAVAFALVSSIAVWAAIAASNSALDKSTPSAGKINFFFGSLKSELNLYYLIQHLTDLN